MFCYAKINRKNSSDGGFLLLTNKGAFRYIHDISLSQDDSELRKEISLVI